MPRTLPWKRSATSTATATTSKRKRDDLSTTTHPKPPTTTRTTTTTAPTPRRSTSPSDQLLPTVPPTPSHLPPSSPRPSPTPAHNQNPPNILSSSPPLSPTHPTPPPPIVYMHEGLPHDDRYLLVEDEFLATAQLYTRSLHAAEYQRLKKLVRSRVAAGDVAGRVERGTDGRTGLSGEGRVRLAQEEARRMRGLGGRGRGRGRERERGLSSSPVELEVEPDDEEEEEEEEGQEMFGLGGLMNRGQDDHGMLKLEGLGRKRATTRAAAGFRGGSLSQGGGMGSSQVRGEEGLQLGKSVLGKVKREVGDDDEGEEDEDDLDAPLRSKPVTARSTGGIAYTSASAPSEHPILKHFKKPSDPPRISTTMIKREPTDRGVPQASSTMMEPPRIKKEPSLNFDDMPKTSALSSKVAARLAKRKAQKEAERNGGTKTLTQNEIPTFLIE